VSRAWAASRKVGALIAAATVVAACLDAAPSGAAPSPTRRPEPTPITTTYEVGTTVWYEGLVLHVDRVTSTLDARGGPVDVTLRVENPRADPAELQATIFLRFGGAPIEPTRESRIPPIPPESEIVGLLTYELQGVSSVADGGVQVGAEPDHIGFAPLTAAAGAAVSLEPRELALTGTATAGELRITVKRGLQRWDLPDWALELAADRQAVSVTFDATFTGGFPGGYPFNAGDNLALRLPDGTDVAPRADGHSRPVELLGPGRTNRGLTARFEIPASVTGRVSLVVLDGDEEALIPLAIPG
jgi:hypothetical protein